MLLNERKQKLEGNKKHELEQTNKKYIIRNNFLYNGIFSGKENLELVEKISCASTFCGKCIYGGAKHSQFYCHIGNVACRRNLGYVQHCTICYSASL